MRGRSRRTRSRSRARPRKRERARLRDRPRRILIWLNPAAEGLVGDARGRRFTEVVSATDRPRAKDAFTKKIIGTAPSTDASVHVLRPDGTEARIEISSAPLHSGHRTRRRVRARLTPRGDSDCADGNARAGWRDGTGGGLLQPQAAKPLERKIERRRALAEHDYAERRRQCHVGRGRRLQCDERIGAAARAVGRNELLRQFGNEIDRFGGRSTAGADRERVAPAEVGEPQIDGYGGVDDVRTWAGNAATDIHARERLAEHADAQPPVNFDVVVERLELE